MSKSTRLDQYLSPARDSQGGVRPRLRYLRCSSPRCGSTLFGQMLFDSGVMGDPLEYLNPSYAAAFFRRFPGHSNSVDAILSTLEGLRTAPSGLFGMQLHFSHFQTLYPDDAAKRQFLARFDRLVFMRRRNKFAQAASLYRATHTGLWSSLEEDIRQAAGIRSQGRRSGGRILGDRGGRYGRAGFPEFDSMARRQQRRQPVRRYVRVEGYPAAIR